MVFSLKGRHVVGMTLSKMLGTPSTGGCHPLPEGELVMFWELGAPRRTEVVQYLNKAWSAGAEWLRSW